MIGFPFREVLDELEHVDDPDVLELARSNRGLRAALALSRPRNWWGTGLTPSSVIEFSKKSGVPVAWVPESHILIELIHAGPADTDRVLRLHENDIVEHCMSLVSECSDGWLDDTRTLVLRAFDAYRAGFHEAAMSLAVSVGEPLAAWASTPRITMFESEEDQTAWNKQRKIDRKYRWAARELEALERNGQVETLEVTRFALIAPIPKFFTEFHPGDPVPTALSRHVVAHQPSVDHLNPMNALISLMLVTSLAYDQEQWAEEVRSNDAVGEGS